MSAARLLALLLVLRACEPFDVARSSRHAELAERRRLEVALGADFSRAACSAAVDTEHSAAASKLSTMCRKRERAARPEGARANAPPRAERARRLGQGKGRVPRKPNARSIAQLVREIPPATLSPREATAPLVLFLHVFKAAGSSVREIFKGWAQECGLRVAVAGSQCAGTGAASRLCLEHGQLKNDVQARRVDAGLDVVAGHLTYGFHAALKRPALYVTMLRNPVSTRVSGALYLARHRIGGDERRAVALARADLREAVARGQLYDNFVRRLTGSDKFKATRNDSASVARLEGATRRAVAHVARGFEVVGVVERFGAFVELVARALDPRGLLGAAWWARVSAIRDNESKVSTTRVIAALEPALVRSANATLAYEWRVYEAAIETFRAQCCSRLGPERCS